MTKKCYYFENTNLLSNALDVITQTFPCFIIREYVEMNYSQITIEAREEDLASIEKILAPLA